MKKLMLIGVLLLIAAPVLAIAQEETETAAEESLLTKIQKAAELIKTSREAREAGIPEEDVKDVLEGARERGLSAEETEAVLAESTAAVEESGPVDNFGAFVQARLDEGLRGQDLAAAIHEEHRQRGKGKGHGKSKMKENGRKGGPKDKGNRPEKADRDDDEEDVRVEGEDHGHDHDHDQVEDQDKDESKDTDRPAGRGKGDTKRKGK